MSEADYLAMTAKRGGNPKIQLSKSKPNTTLADLVYEAEEPKTKFDTAANSVERSTLHTLAEPGKRFAAAFFGARLLTLNDLLRIDMRQINRYRKVWHERALVALLSSNHPRTKFDSPIRLTLIRRGTKLVDNDALAAMFKFAIDGFKEAGLIRDDNPTIVETIDLVQSTGPYAAALLFEDIAVPANRQFALSLIERNIP